MTKSQTGDSSPRVDPAKGWERYLTSRTQDGVTATVNVGVLSDLIHSAITTLEAENARLRAVVDAARHHLGHIQYEARLLPLSVGRNNIEYAAQQALSALTPPDALDQGEG